MSENTSNGSGSSGSSYGNFHRRVIESRGATMAVLTTIAISIGGIVEIVPMFTKFFYSDQSIFGNIYCYEI